MVRAQPEVPHAKQHRQGRAASARTCSRAGPLLRLGRVGDGLIIVPAKLALGDLVLQSRWCRMGGKAVLLSDPKRWHGWHCLDSSPTLAVLDTAARQAHNLCGRNNHVKAQPRRVLATQAAQLPALASARKGSAVSVEVKRSTLALRSMMHCRRRQKWVVLLPWEAARRSRPAREENSRP